MLSDGGGYRRASYATISVLCWYSEFDSEVTAFLGQNVQVWRWEGLPFASSDEVLERLPR